MREIVVSEPRSSVSPVVSANGSEQLTAQGLDALRDENHCVAEIDVANFAAIAETPPMPG